LDGGACLIMPDHPYMTGKLLKLCPRCGWEWYEEEIQPEPTGADVCPLCRDDLGFNELKKDAEK